MERKSKEHHKKGMEYMKYIEYILIAGAATSLLIAILGCIFASIYTNYICVMAIISSLITICGMMYGYHAMRTFEKEVKEYYESDNEDLHYLEKTKGRKMVEIFLYVLIIMFFWFIFLGTLALLFKDEIFAKLVNLDREPELWKEYFGDSTFGTISGATSALLLLIGLLCLVSIGICVYIFYEIVKHSNLYHLFRILFLFANFLLMLLGIGLLYQSIYAKMYLDVGGATSGSYSAIPIILLIISLFLILLAFVGFFAAYFEFHDVLKIYALLLGLLAFFTFFAVLATFISMSEIKKGFKDNCFILMDHVHFKKMNYFSGCQNKYSLKFDDLSDSRCPKAQIFSYWEDNVNKPIEEHTDKYGCLNDNCCDLISSTYASKIFYLGLLAFVVVICALGCAIGAYYLYTVIDSTFHRGEDLNKVFFYYIAVLAVLLLISNFIIKFKS